MSFMLYQEIRQQMTGGCLDRVSVYGLTWIDPKLNQTAIWSFQINKITKGSDFEKIVFCIVSNNKSCMYGVSSAGESFMVGDGSIASKKAFQFGEGDEIEIHLNTKLKAIMTKKNKEQWQVNYTGIKVDGVKYRIAVHIITRNGSVTLNNFRLRSD